MPGLKKASPAQVKKERDPAKVKAVIKAKTGKDELSKGKVLHHVKPVAEGGKTTKDNTRIITETKHKQIHANRRKVGRI